MAKRYLLFAYPTFYPLGGAQDLIGWFNSIEEAEQELSRIGAAAKISQWAHVFDIEAGFISRRWKNDKGIKWVDDISDFWETKELK